MDPFLTLFVVIAAAVAVLVGRLAWRRRQVRRLERARFPEPWEAVCRRWGWYRRLHPELRRRLRGRLQVFLAQKRFFGCAGQEVDEAMRVLIAAQACLLDLQGEGEPYPELRTLLIYPSAYRAREEVVDEAGVVHEGEAARLGESWERGQVVLAWDEIEADLRAQDDGRNVVVHEFAHQLDQADGSVDGAPALGSGRAYRDWAQVFEAEYAALQRQVEAGEEPFLDPYGASAPEEFFAVASEHFFEEPAELAAEHPQLFGQLLRYYRLDPRDWCPST